MDLEVVEGLWKSSLEKEILGMVKLRLEWII